MKFKIQTSLLLNALEVICSAVELGKKGTIPILNYCLLKLNKGILHLTVTDIDVTAKITIPVDESMEDGETCVLARKLLDMTQACKNNIFEFTREEAPDKWLIIKTVISGKPGGLSIPTMNPKSFPATPALVAGDKFINASTLSALINHTLFAIAAKDEVKSNLELCISSKLIQAAATDGGRMAIASSKVSVPGSKVTLYVPKRGAVALKKVADLYLDSPDTQIGFSVDDNLIYFSCENIKIFCRKLAIEFPAWRTIYSKIDEDVLVTMKSDEIIQAMTVVNSVGHNEVSFSTRGKTLALSEKSVEGNSEFELKVESTLKKSEVVDVLFSPEFVVNFLASARSLNRESAITMVIPTERSPILFKAASDDVLLEYICAARRKVE